MKQLQYLKSSDLRDLKPTKKVKKVLLINPKKEDIEFTYPHNGLAILAGILKKRGHEVLIADFAFLIEERDKDISFFINMFKPDIIGISIYTPNSKEANILIKKINEISPNTPLMVGGYHAFMYSNLLQKDKRIDYIFIGDGELPIIPIVENAKKEKTPKIVQAKSIIFKLDEIPLPEYKAFYGWQKMTHYPLMTSRGCPNRCTFCVNSSLQYRFWRYRKPEECIKELEIAKKEISPDLKIVIFDDCPTTIKVRFHKFLNLYIQKIKNELMIVNTRADSLDEETIKLMKKCGVSYLAVGVEHGNPKVFEMVNKGETFEDIKKACRLIKKHGIELGVTFIIGLPGDTLKRTKDSIKLCKELKPDFLGLNLMIPFRNTAAREWFDKNQASIYDELDFGSIVLPPLECPRIMVETPDFSVFEREKAYYMFLFGVADPKLKLIYMPKIISITRKYDLYSEFFDWLPRGIIKSFKRIYIFSKRGFKIYKKGGFGLVLGRFIKIAKQRRINKEYLKTKKI
jgi:anaerobic magnesium-protoporphyrin IX monomethyl ester cyclase